MLDREAVCCFLQIQLEKWGIKPPMDMSMDILLETFCRFVEEDYYEWLKDNFKTFFQPWESRLGMDKRKDQRIHE